MKLRPGSGALTALLALFTTVGPLSIDLYVPALPELGRVLGASDAAAQLTISVYVFGFAAGQLVHGPASDRYGRRPVLMVALSIFCLGALACGGRADDRYADRGALRARLRRLGRGWCSPRAVIRDLYEAPARRASSP